MSKKQLKDSEYIYAQHTFQTNIKTLQTSYYVKLPFVNLFLVCMEYCRHYIKKTAYS